MTNFIKALVVTAAIAVFGGAFWFIFSNRSVTTLQDMRGNESARPPDISVPKAPEQKMDETADQYNRRKQVYEANLDGLIYASTDAIESRCNTVGWKVVSFDTNETGKGTVKMEAGSVVGADMGREISQTTRWAYAMTQKQCLDLYLKKLATDDLAKVVWTSDLNVGHDSGELSAFNTLVEKLHATYGIDLSADQRIKGKATSIDTDSYKNKADELNVLDRDVVISMEFSVTKPPPPAAPGDVTLRAPHIINSHGYNYSYVVYLDGAQIKPEIVTHLAGLVGKPPIRYTVWGAPKPILTKDALGKITTAEIRITPMAIW